MQYIKKTGAKYKQNLNRGVRYAIYYCRAAQSADCASRQIARNKYNVQITFQFTEEHSLVKTSLHLQLH